MSIARHCAALADRLVPWNAPRGEQLWLVRWSIFGHSLTEL